MSRKIIQPLLFITVLIALILAQPQTISAQEATPTPDPDPSQVTSPFFDPEGSDVEIVATGEGWQQLRLGEVTDELIARGVPIDPESKINEVLVINGVAGLANVELPGTMAQNMMSTMVADGGVNDVIIVNLELLEALEAGDEERAAELHSTLDMVDEPEDGSANRGCSSGWYNKVKVHQVTFNDLSSTNQVNVGGVNVGQLNITAPVQGHLRGELHYQIWKEKIWFVCITLAVRYNMFVSSGSLNMQQGLVDLEIPVINNERIFNWHKQVMRPKIGSTFVMAGAVPIIIQFYLPVDVGLLGYASLHAHFGIQSHAAGFFTFNMTCLPGQGCQGTRDGDFDLNNNTPIQPVGALELNLQVMAYLQPGFQASLYFAGFLDVYVNVRIGLVGNLWGYIGNACGDGDDDGHAEIVYALMLDVEVVLNTYVGMEIFGITIFDEALPPGFLTKLNAGWREVQIGGKTYIGKFLRNFDLLSSVGGSTAMTPLFLHQNSSNNEYYVVKMRPCVPYTHQVTYQINWGDGQTQTVSGAPQTSVVVNHSWSGYGTFNFTAGAVSDSLGRQFMGATPQSFTRTPTWDNVPPVATSSGLSNLSFLAQVTASSTGCIAGPLGVTRCFKTESVNNGIINTTDTRPAASWANSGTLPQWLQLQWPYPIETNQVVIYTTAGLEMRDFALEYWNGSAWQGLVTVQNNLSTSITLQFPMVQTNSLRVVGQKGPVSEPNMVRINEIEVMARRINPAWVTYMRPLNSQKCLDIPGTLTGLTAQQLPCSETANQNFAFFPVANEPNTYTIVAMHTGKCLEMAGSQNGATLRQQNCTQATNQKFRLSPINNLGSNRYFQIVGHSSQKCLDVTDNQVANGTPIQQYTCHALTGPSYLQVNQIWYLQNKP